MIQCISTYYNIILFCLNLTFEAIFSNFTFYKYILNFFYIKWAIIIFISQLDRV